MILESAEDYTNWGKLIKHCETLDGLTELEREKAKRAFRLLEKEFGSHFLQDAFHKEHPLTGYIQNLAPWTRKWLVRFSESIQELKHQENYKSLLERLKDSDRFREGQSVLEVAYKFSKAGFSIAVDPSVNVSGNQKVPDLKLTNTDTKEELFVEVSMLGEARSEKESMETMRKITEPLWRSIPFVRYCGRVHKILAENHLTDIVEKVKETVEKAQKDNFFQELVIENVIEIGIAPQSDTQFMDTWASERGLAVGSFTGPPFNIDETWRVKQRIENKQRQLPHMYPNILVLWDIALFFQMSDIRKTISELEESVYNYPHLMAAVIAGVSLERGNNENIMKDQHVYIRRRRDNLLTEQYIILLNQYCEQKVSPSTITKMYYGFGRY